MTKPAGYDPFGAEGLPSPGRGEPLATPLYQSSTYFFRSTEELAEVAGGSRGGYFYSRYANPNCRAAEKAVAALEGAEEALAFASGMAATSTVALSLCRTGDRIAAFRDLYGSTSALFDAIAAFGIQTAYAETGDYEGLERQAKGAKLVWFETPTNPLCRVVDLERVAGIGRRTGAVTAVDSTFASPINQNPIRAGIDLVMHSATKYLGGHSDTCSGVVAGRRELIERLERFRRLLGGVLDPHPAWVLERSLKTLEMRIERTNANALAVARFLEGAAGIAEVRYPGLPSHPDQEIARRQMRGFGGMMAFEVKGGDEEAFAFADRLRRIRIAPSLGGVESIVSHPVLTSHRLPPEERARRGIRPGLVRLSVGVEPVEELIQDLSGALRGNA